MKGAVFQNKTENPANQQWVNAAAANAALASVTKGPYPVGWTRNYFVQIDPHNQGHVLPPGIDYIPTIFGDVGLNPDFGSECTQANIDIAKTTTTTGELVSLTEPNHADQSNITPARAAQLWPLIRGSGLRITSPVVAISQGDPLIGTAGTWIDQFVTALGSADWDITAFDMYIESTSNLYSSVAAIAAQLDAAHAKWGKPVWLNETGFITFGSLPSNPPTNAVEAYMRAMIAMCEARPWVERWAFYRIGPGDADVTGYFNIALNNIDGSQTALGKYYQTLWDVPANDNGPPPLYALPPARERRRRRGGRLRRAA